MLGHYRVFGNSLAVRPKTTASLNRYELTHALYCRSSYEKIGIFPPSWFWHDHDRSAHCHTHQCNWNVKNGLQCVSFLPGLNAKQMRRVAEHHFGCWYFVSQMVLYCLVSKRGIAFCLMPCGLQHFTKCATLPSNRRYWEVSELLFTCLTVHYSSCFYLKVLGVQDGYRLWLEKVQRPGKHVKSVQN